MTNPVLGISVKARADFSDVTREGAKAAREIREQFSGGNKRIGADPLGSVAPMLGGRTE